MDRAQIRHVAELAELELTEEEEERLAGEVGRILAYVAELDAIDTSDVPPTAHVMAEGQAYGELLRPDEPEEGLSHDDALAAAPRAAHGGFEVPTFVE
jgi:aspartyl-tRNA(Asn)/glutamyl-tRNA(Gln) amidotransferase subunit C